MKYENMKKVSVTIDSNNLDMLKELSVGLGLNRSEIIRMVLTLYSGTLKSLSGADLIDAVELRDMFINENSKK